MKILIFFKFLLKNIECGYSYESPRRGGSYMYPQFMFLSIRDCSYEYPQSISLAEAVLASTHNLCLEQKYEKYQNFHLRTFSFGLWNYQYTWIGVFS